MCHCVGVVLIIRYYGPYLNAFLFASKADCERNRPSRAIGEPNKVNCMNDMDTKATLPLFEPYGQSVAHSSKKSVFQH